MMVVFLSLVNRVTIYCIRAFICCLAGWKICFLGENFPIKREILARLSSASKRYQFALQSRFGGRVPVKLLLFSRRSVRFSSLSSQVALKGSFQRKDFEREKNGAKLNL